MIMLWQSYQNGMGAGHLPDAGGVMDQSVLMLEAFNVMSNARKELEKQNGR